MEKNRAQILKMIGRGELTAEEGQKMLDELGRGLPPTKMLEPKPQWPGFKFPKLLRIKVRERDTKVNLWIPIPLIMMFLSLGKLAINFAPRDIRNEPKINSTLEAFKNLSAREVYDIFRSIKREVPDGKIVEVEEDGGETKVEIRVV